MDKHPFMIAPEHQTIDPTHRDRVTETFAILGNKTRMAILLALWEARTPTLDSDDLSFSELRERVGVRDSGQFNYHLDQLTNRFVEQTESGYRLRHTGEMIIQSIIGTAAFETPEFEPTIVDLPCKICDAPTAVQLRDGLLYWICTECEGAFEGDQLPSCCLIQTAVDSAAGIDRTPEELLSLGKFRLNQHVHNQMEGICPICSGMVEQSLDICDEHSTTGACEQCGRRDRIKVRFECRVCKDWGLIHPAACVLFHPAVVAFLYEQGISFQWDVDNFETVKQEMVHFDNDVHLLSLEPPEIHVEITYGDASIHLQLDRQVDVTILG